MKAVSLVLLLVAAAMGAEEVKEAREVKEVVEPQARALAVAPLSAAPYQFGARATPYHQAQYYQPQHHYQTAQHGYYQGFPAQTYYSGSPYYQQGAYGAKYYQGSQGAQYYHGGQAQYYPGSAGYYPGSAAYYSGSASYYPGAPAQFSQFAAKSAVHAAPAAPVVIKGVPAPAPFIKAAPAVVGVHHEAERFAAPAVVRAHATPIVHAAPVAHAAPAHIVKAAPHPAAVEPYHVIVKQSNDDNFDGSFAYSYETDHGIAVESTGFVKNAGTPDQVQVMQGSYTYYTPEGVPITTTYIADENGFQVQGDHLPVPPPMPEAIAKSIEYQRSLPPSAEDIMELERAQRLNPNVHRAL